MKIHHVCIETSDYEKSLWFYTKVLNFKMRKETKKFQNREYNTWLELDGFYIELQTPKKNQKIKEDGEHLGIVHLCFYVKNINEEFEKIKLKYQNFKRKNDKFIYEVEGGKLFKVIAPEGTIIEIRDNILF